MIIEWKSGVYAHNQSYYDLGLALNWPGTSTFVAFIPYNEEIGGNVIFTEALAKTIIMTEEQIKDVVLTESISKEVVH